MAPMAMRRLEMVLLSMIFVAATILGGAMAQSNCQSVIISLAPCLNYITGNSSTPSAPCCTQLATVVQSQPRCLCEVINGGGSSLGLTINQTLAMALPGACDVQTPPVSRCNGDAPAGSPASPSDPSGNNGGGTGRSSGGEPSAGDSLKLPSSILFFLFAASFASTFNNIPICLLFEYGTIFP